MDQGNVISFNELKEKKGNTEKKVTGRIEDVIAYWDAKVEGAVHDKYINLFLQRFDNTFASIAESLTHMNMYMADNDRPICLQRDIGVINETGFAYADFYDWFTDNFMEDPDVENLLEYNFNGELPPVLQFGENAFCDLIALKNANTFDQMKESTPLKKDGKRLMDYINRKSNQMSFVTFLDADGEDCIANQIAFYSEMDKRTRKHMIRLFKANLLQLGEDCGHIIFVYLNGGEELILNAFEVDYEGIRAMDKNATAALCDSLSERIEEEDYLEEVINASVLGKIEKASFGKRTSKK